jgi:hypothetical protein
MRYILRPFLRLCYDDVTLAEGLNPSGDVAFLLPIARSRHPQVRDGINDPIAVAASTIPDPVASAFAPRCVDGVWHKWGIFAAKTIGRGVDDVSRTYVSAATSGFGRGSIPPG